MLIWPGDSSFILHIYFHRFLTEFVYIILCQLTTRKITDYMNTAFRKCREFFFIIEFYASTYIYILNMSVQSSMNQIITPLAFQSLFPLTLLRNN